MRLTMLGVRGDPVNDRRASRACTSLEHSERSTAFSPTLCPIMGGPLHIYVDADACPVKNEIYRVAERYDLPVTLVSGSSMWIPSAPNFSLEVVGQGFDAADDWIVTH